MKAYIACSFAFPDANIKAARQKDIIEVKHVLMNKGFDVFVPHEHKIEYGERMSNYVWALAVQDMDKNALKEADWVVLMTYGKAGNNAGVAWEAGYAYGLNKNLLIVKMTQEIESCMMFPNSHAQVWGISGLSRFNFDNPDTWDCICDIEMS